MRLLIGSIIHDRGEITRCFAKHIRALDLAGIDASWCWVLDESYAPVGDLDLPAETGSFISVQDDGPAYERKPDGDGYSRTTAYARLAFLRNVLRERAMYEHADGLVSIDSDIMAPPDLLQQLCWRGPWVSALVDNSALCNGARDAEVWHRHGGPQLSPLTCYNMLDIGRDENGTAITIRTPVDWQAGGWADIGGAACYYARGLLLHCGWRPHPAGEDVGFGLRAMELGMRCQYVPLVCDHLMTAKRLAMHRKGCPICR